MNNELITANKLAEHLGVSQYTVRIWANKNVIPFIRISPKTLRFYLPDVIEALRAKQRGFKKPRSVQDSTKRSTA